MKYGSASFDPARTPFSASRPTRRMLLRGAGGVAIGLPYLSSLLPREVKAAVAPKRFLAIAASQGGVREPSMMPAQSVATERSSTSWGHTIKHGSLVKGAKQVGDDTVLSPVLTAPRAILSERLLSKMNVLVGLDYDVYLGHHSGGHLGNFKAHRNGPADVQAFPTLDQLLAWSPKFYADLSGVKQRVAVTGLDDDIGMSWGWSNPSTHSGDLNITPVMADTRVLFDKLFAGAKAPPPGEPAPPRRPPVVDRILQHYKTLRNSDRRLSTEDRRRLDDHIAKLDELQRRVNDNGSGRKLKQCSLENLARDVKPTESLQSALQYESVVNDVIAMALACGVTRIAVNLSYGSFSDYAGDWHDHVVHEMKIMGAESQALMVPAKNRAFRATALDLASKLDSFEESPGVSLLDSCLLQWTQESGSMTHDAHDMTMVTFGSAGGAFNTGLFVDYRSKMPQGENPGYGVMHRQWLATVAMAMGLSPSDFEVNGKPGYGVEYNGKDAEPNKRPYAPAVFSQASKPMPVVSNL